MDELYAFLFGGLILMFLLFVFFGGGFYTSYQQPTPVENKTKEELTWRTIELGTITILKQNLTKKEIISENFKVHNGLFAGNQIFKAKYEVNEEVLNNLASAKLNYYIKNSNWYGTLNVKFNNKTIYSGKPPVGKYEFNIQPKKENIIEFETSSSGWKIWAPSAYQISNLSVNLNYGYKEFPRYDFFVSQKIINNFHKAELIFVPNEEKTLTISLNNETIYEDLPHKGFNTITLNKLKKGNNNFVFSSNDTIILKNVRLVLYYYT